METKDNQAKDTGLSIFLNSFFHKLSLSSVKHAILGNYQRLPYYTSNDVDIWVSDLSIAKATVKDVAFETKSNLVIWNENLSGVNVFFRSPHGEAIHIDLITAVKYRSLFELLPNRTIEQNRMEHKGLIVANDDVTLLGHLLYPLMTFGKVKSKYRDKLYIATRESERFRNLLEHRLGSTLGNKIVSLVKQKDWFAVEGLSGAVKRQVIMAEGLKAPHTLILASCRLALNHLARYLRPSGAFVALVGMDGSGKSTVIRELSAEMARFQIQENSKTGYWRPFLLPRLNKLIVTPNRDRLNEAEYIGERISFSKVKSLVKYAYYLVDYILGGILDRSFASRGGVVIYDRHYDDLIVYPERFGMTLPEGLVRFGRRMIPQPDLVIYLRCSADVLLSRKKELYRDEMDRQLLAYESLSHYENVISINGEQNLGSVVEDVTEATLQVMARKADIASGGKFKAVLHDG